MAPMFNAAGFVILCISIIANLIFAYVIGGPPDFLMQIDMSDPEDIKVDMRGNIDFEDLKHGHNYRIRVLKNKEKK